MNGTEPIQQPRPQAAVAARPTAGPKPGQLAAHLETQQHPIRRLLHTFPWHQATAHDREAAHQALHRMPVRSVLHAMHRLTASQTPTTAQHAALDLLRSHLTQRQPGRARRLSVANQERARISEPGQGSTATHALPRVHGHQGAFFVPRGVDIDRTLGIRTRALTAQEMANLLTKPESADLGGAVAARMQHRRDNPSALGYPASFASELANMGPRERQAAVRWLEWNEPAHAHTISQFYPQYWTGEGARYPQEAARMGPTQGQVASRPQPQQPQQPQQPRILHTPAPQGQAAEDARRAAVPAGFSKARVTFHEDAQEHAYEILGQHEPHHIASLVGAPDDAHVHVEHDPLRGGLYVKGTHPGVDNWKRHIRMDRQGRLYLYNDILTQAEEPESTREKPIYTHPGLGGKIFAKQVETAQKMGFDRIETHAAGYKGHPYFSGYYKWPLMGYDQPVSELDPGARSRVRNAFPNAKTILDIFDSPGGEQWWEENGDDLFHAVFDLKPGSRSLARHEKYKAERAARGRPI